ncbi:hypothetical protein ACFQU2_13865 [Siccirubricoccus deserti]
MPQLGVADIRKSLRRASIAVSYPNIFRDVRASPAAVVMPAASAPELSIPATDVVSSVLPVQDAGNGANESGLARRRFQSTQDLIDLGRLRVGDTLAIRGRDDSSARVLDGWHVEFKGQRMSFNKWGQRVTGWPSIRIYTMACLSDGRTLNDLRDQSEPSSTTV